MKEIKNWQAIIKDEDGNEQIALPLPGCIIKGEIKEELVEVTAIDVDTSNLVIIDSDGQKYLLSGVNEKYISNMQICIQFGQKENKFYGEER